MTVNFIILTLCGARQRWRKVGVGGARLESVGRGSSSNAELQCCQLVRAIWPKYLELAIEILAFKNWYPAQAAAAAAAAAAAPSPRPEISEEA